MPKIRVDGDQKNPRPYWPKALVDEGFVGEMEVLDDALTATVIHPNATYEQVKKSLQLVIKDIDLRMEREKAEAEKGENVGSKSES